MAFIYLTLEQAVKIHRNTVEVSGGGALGKLNMGQLESVLEQIQNDDYYPTFQDKLTHLFFGACMFHCFEDGNKRIAITLCAQMLLFNGYMAVVERFLHEMENISYHVAASKIDKDLLRRIIHAVINFEMDEDEILKLDIFSAIS
ncbi:MAG: Fic family protein [Victivallaceae bacterium]|nr:Fic family protein [Victivallaceae bacterium]